MIAVERAINAKEASDIREAMLVVAENPVKDIEVGGIIDKRFQIKPDYLSNRRERQKGEHG